MASSLIHKTVLVVEDDPTYSKLWQRLLHEMGVYQIITSKDPEEALEILQHTAADLLISDVTLPKVNGYELSHRVRKLVPNIQVLLTTGYQTDLSRFDLKSPRFHLLHKPYHDLEQIRKLIAMLLTNQNPQQNFDEDSFSENQEYPEITEWTL